MENIRAELFFLKQFGFSSTLLNSIFLLKKDPLNIIFNKEYELYFELINNFTEKDINLAKKFDSYNEFKLDLYSNEEFLKGSKSKIYFKYDDNVLTNLIPNKIMPLFMYALGDTSLLTNEYKKVAIVGTRTPSLESIETTKKITKKYIEQGYVIVSGLAEGIDTVSHEAAIFYKGYTIAVLPSSLNNIYPKKNEQLAKEIVEQGLLLTAIGPKENTYKSTFLERNQYVANISDLVIIIETNLKSGTMNTIRNASEANKKILFVDQKDEAVNEKIIRFGGEMINEE